ncbi:hypothetical protein [Bacillus sp. NTK034]|uniref:hypothetical protein n=1 Tax=Bacillus sp. NTK034 TaxID=2802176 RepID=UPI001A8CBD76|nr:hypothetical protein [Bacillus sp. NTK034]MBN8200503.1 hypothetical protein [Bacillus sp. NTK034]
MKIQIEDKLFVESDERQFIVKQYNGKFDDKGVEGYKPLGYFSKLQQAVKFLVKHELMKSNAETIGELLSDLERIEKRLEELIRI